MSLTTGLRTALTVCALLAERRPAGPGKGLSCTAFLLATASAFLALGSRGTTTDGNLLRAHRSYDLAYRSRIHDLIDLSVHPQLVNIIQFEKHITTRRQLRAIRICMDT